MNLPKIYPRIPIMIQEKCVGSNTHIYHNSLFFIFVSFPLVVHILECYLENGRINLNESFQLTPTHRLKCEQNGA